MRFPLASLLIAGCLTAVLDAATTEVKASGETSAQIEVDDYKKKHHRHHHRKGHHHRSHHKTVEPHQQQHSTQANTTNQSHLTAGKAPAHPGHLLMVGHNKTRHEENRGSLQVNAPLPADFAELFQNSVAEAVNCKPSDVQVLMTREVKEGKLVEVSFEAPPKVVEAVLDEAGNPESKLAGGALCSFLVERDARGQVGDQCETQGNKNIYEHQEDEDEDKEKAEKQKKEKKEEEEEKTKEKDKEEAEEKEKEKEKETEKEKEKEKEKGKEEAEKKEKEKKEEEEEKESEKKGKADEKEEEAAEKEEKEDGEEKEEEEAHEEKKQAKKKKKETESEEGEEQEPQVKVARDGTKIDVDVQMPYGDLEPFGREDTAQELTEAAIEESNAMVDQLERAEVAEEKRAVFRALTRLRGAAITSFDGIARAQTGNIDEYAKVNQWRAAHPVRHLANEEDDISKWAFPDAN